MAEKITRIQEKRHVSTTNTDGDDPRENKFKKSCKTSYNRYNDYRIGAYLELAAVRIRI